MAGNEFGFGVFAFVCMLLTHPERLSTGDTLMIDCSGDEYSVRGDYTFDRVPLFDYDMAGIEFSIFYEDRARNLWERRPDSSTRWSKTRLNAACYV